MMEEREDATGGPSISAASGPHAGKVSEEPAGQATILNDGLSRENVWLRRSHGALRAEDLVGICI